MTKADRLHFDQVAALGCCLSKTLTKKPVYVVKLAQHIRLAGPMCHFPKPSLQGRTAMSDSNSTFKFCPKCNAETDRCKNGRCRPCQTRMHKDWKLRNPEIIAANRRTWAAANKEKVSEINRKQRLKNPEFTNGKKAAYRAENKEKISEAGRIYRENNKEAIRTLKANRRAKKREAGGSLSSGLVDRLMVLQRGRCACCNQRLGDSYHLDHIMPIALGGQNIDGNIQLLTARCNLQKKAKHPVDFMQQRGFLL